MLQAFEAAGSDTPLWTAEDRQWATRVAREEGAGSAGPAQALDQRARHALQRLAPRDPTVPRLLARRMWNTAWAPVVLALAFVAGIAVDAIGGTQRINLLAPPVWAVIAWNLAVYLGLLLPRPAVPRGLRALLARRLAGAGGGSAPLRAYAAAWAQASLPLAATRAAVLLHVAAAALALGLVAGLYVRGLVLDYRAGWESTFLDPAAVRALLAALLAPASAATGIAVPDEAGIAALRLGPGVAAMAGAAHWIHLYAAMLALFVIGPRLALAALAGSRAAWGARHVALPLQEPYFQRLLRDLQSLDARVQVLPHGAAPSPQATLALRAWLAAACGDSLQLSLVPPTPYGQEDDIAAPEPGTTLRVLLVDLGSTPEDDTQGRALALLRAQPQAPGAPLLVLADEAGWRRRFARLPARLDERRAAWRGFAQRHGAGFLGLDLDQPETAGAESALQGALQAAEPTARP
jgi:Protein of unknown function (DUF2868)